MVSELDAAVSQGQTEMKIVSTSLINMGFDELRRTLKDASFPVKELEGVEAGDAEGLLKAALALVEKDTNKELAAFGGEDTHELKAAYARLVMVRRQKDTCSALKSKSFDKNSTRSILEQFCRFLSATSHPCMTNDRAIEEVMSWVDGLLAHAERTPVHEGHLSNLRRWVPTITPHTMKEYFDCKLTPDPVVGQPQP